MEHSLAADPERADAVDAYREAMDVWREDAARNAAAAADVEEMADRVAAAVAERPRLLRRAAAPWYAAAALVLIGVGIAGTLLTDAGKPSPSTDQADALSFAEFENVMLDLVIDSPELSPPLASGPK